MSFAKKTIKSTKWLCEAVGGFIVASLFSLRCVEIKIMQMYEIITLVITSWMFKKNCFLMEIERNIFIRINEMN